MLNVTVNREDGIVTLEPDGVLTQKDFESAATVIDPYIEMAGTLNGVIIHTKVFPGWDSFAAMLTHLKFVQDHHKRVSHVAFVTDSKLGDLAEVVGSHFVQAEVKHFRFGELNKARLWVLGLG
ncbi:MAG: STAS/SEC14 domain-containing protein [Gammaproteobacteria bacterium]|nr:STAS/SEC14 domain-containing protein [Gammaproteobacteria bacterium]